MTNLYGLERLRVPGDLTDEQMHQLFALNLTLVNRIARKSVKARGEAGQYDVVIQEALDDLSAWFMAQNFHSQVRSTE